MSEPSGPDTDGPPEQSEDDTDRGWGERPADGSARDRWLEEQRPPHYE